MFPLKNKSLINDKIAKFYKIPNSQNSVSVSHYFERNGVYNSKKIVDFLWPQQDSCEIFTALQDYTYDEYLECYYKLLPIFQYSKYIFENLTKNGYDSLKIQWLGKNINKYLEMKNNPGEIGNTEAMETILLLTSVLENALANVYFTQTCGKQAPHLLRDLINTPEIREVFDIELILILKILMGSPNSINLRNIVWHGFPKPFEIPDYYEYVLLVTAHSLGSIIELKNIELKERPQIENFVKQLEVFEEDLKCNHQYLNNIEVDILEIHNEFAKDFKPYWQQLFSYYISQNYIECIIMLLPQIELLLRLHYGHINNFDISAKLDEYYITMDSIFEAEVQNSATSINMKSNELLNFEISPFEGCFHLIYDIFISPNGCRLRDKVSHGESCLEALQTSELCSLVLHIFLNLLWPNQFKTLLNYKSKLHINALAKRNLLECKEKLQSFNLKQLENSMEVSLQPKDTKLLIFQRPKRESELMLLIKKILENIIKTLNNYEESITVRSFLMTQRELHSKRRKTLEKLQNVLPDIWKTLVKMWESNCKIYKLLQTSFEDILEDNNKCMKTIRFLKHSLTISENFVKYSHYDSNEWIKSLDLCRKFEEFHTKWFLYIE